MSQQHDPLPPPDGPEAEPSQPGPGWFARHTVFTTVGAVLLVLVVGGIATGGGGRDPRGEDTAAVLPAPGGGEEFGDGDYTVGQDLPEGTYVSDGARSAPPLICSVTTEPSDPDRLPQFRAGGRDERIEITLDTADGVVTVRGCQPLTLRQQPA